MASLTDWLRQPLVQFFLLGAGIYGLYALTGSASKESPGTTIVLTQERITSLAETWEAARQQPPTDRELQSLNEAYIREEMLYREALAMGLDKEDAVIRRYLAQKLEFLVSDLYEAEEPTDAELEAFYRENTARYEVAARLTFTQLFFSSDRDGESVKSDLAVALEELRSGTRMEDLGDAGDRFLLPRQFKDVSTTEIARQFGQAFADQLVLTAPGSWQGPVKSGFGWHLVYIETRQAAYLPDLAGMREAVMADWQLTRSRELNEQFVRRIAENYEVKIESAGTE